MKNMIKFTTFICCLFSTMYIVLDIAVKGYVEISNIPIVLAGAVLVSLLAFAIGGILWWMDKKIT